MPSLVQGAALICNLCEEPGHRSAACPNKDKCQLCKQPGHRASQGPDPWGASRSQEGAAPSHGEDFPPQPPSPPVLLAEVPLPADSDLSDLEAPAEEQATSPLLFSLNISESIPASCPSSAVGVGPDLPQESKSVVDSNVNEVIEVNEPSDANEANNAIVVDAANEPSSSDFSSSDCNSSDSDSTEGDSSSASSSEDDLPSVRTGGSPSSDPGIAYGGPSAEGASAPHKRKFYDSSDGVSPRVPKLGSSCEDLASGPCKLGASRPNASVVVSLPGAASVGGRQAEDSSVLAAAPLRSAPQLADPSSVELVPPTGGD